MITDKIVKVTADGDYKGTPKFKVQLSQNGQFTFFGNFNAKEGQTIKYQVNNEKYKTAKLISIASDKPVAKYDTGQSILRQVAFKGAIELATSDKIDLNDIEYFTNEFHNLLNK